MNLIKSLKKFSGRSGVSINDERVEIKKIVIIKSPCAVSIALLGQEFIHFIQLSQLNVQYGRLLIFSMAFTGHCFIHISQLSHLLEA